jgi:hypothetical protein
MKTTGCLLVLILSIVFGCSSGGFLEDPAIGIIKRADAGVFKTVDNLMKQIAGPNGDVKWSSFKASKLQDEAFRPNGKNPFKNNPDVSIVQVDVKKVLTDEKEKKVLMQFAVNTKTEAYQIFGFQIDGEPQSLLFGW